MESHLNDDLANVLLRAKMLWYKEQCVRLQSEKDALERDAIEQIQTLHDVISHLNTELKGRDLQIMNLSQLLAAAEARALETRKSAEEHAKESQKARAEAEAREHLRVTLLVKRLQGAHEVFEQNKLLMIERNALQAALSEEQMKNEKRFGDLDRLHVHERNEWEQKLDAQIRSAVSAAEQAVMISGVAKGDIDSELQYQAQQIDFMYDSMKEAKAKMAAMRRELEVSREVQGKLTVQNCALQRAINALAQRLREQVAAQPQDHPAFPTVVKHRPVDIAVSAASLRKSARRNVRSIHRTPSSVAHRRCDV